MARMAMSVLVINMGGEMVYIIDQRLRAQNIPIDKSVRVLEEVTATMFNTKFIDEMFKPHPVQNLDALQQIFRRLAHSSIMRLNEPSMEKLYDLMTMGFKFQLMSSTIPSDVVRITRNHLNSLIELFPMSARHCVAVSLIQRALQTVNKLFASVAEWEFAVLRYRLLDVLQDRKIKVSLLLQSNLQDTNGAIVVTYERRGSQPSMGDPLGMVRVFTSRILTQTFNITFPSRQIAATAATAAPPVVAENCALGSNIYENDNRTESQAAATSVASTSSGLKVSAPTQLLTDLIKIMPPDPTFRLELDLITTESSSTNQGSSGSSFQKIVAPATSIKADIISKLDDVDNDANHSADDIDLLGLMDALPPDP